MITNDILYIGVNDYESDIFEGQYSIPNGISYNSYLIMDEKIAITDTVDKCKCGEYLEKLQTALSGKTPDYLIVHHMEPDHAAGIKAVLDRYPGIRIVASAAAIRMMPQYFDADISSAIAVKDGDELCLGRHTLTFITAPMVHWPEVIMSYDKTDKVLFSADAFGKFGAMGAQEEWDDEARRYYFNIVGKFGAQVQAVLKKASALDIQVICPLHGEILKQTIPYVLEKYSVWSSYTAESNGVFIAYASMHGNTANAALKLAEILKEKGCTEVALSDLSRDDSAKALANAFRYGRLVLAAPSYNGGVMPLMADFLNHLTIKNYQNRTVAIIENGSWAPSCAKTIKECLSQMKDIALVEPVVTVRGALKEQDIGSLELLAEKIIG